MQIRHCITSRCSSPRALLLMMLYQLLLLGPFAKRISNCIQRRIGPQVGYLPTVQIPPTGSSRFSIQRDSPGFYFCRSCDGVRPFLAAAVEEESRNRILLQSVKTTTAWEPQRFHRDSMHVEPQCRMRVGPQGTRRAGEGSGKTTTPVPCMKRISLSRNSLSPGHLSQTRLSQ